MRDISDGERCSLHNTERTINTESYPMRPFANLFLLLFLIDGT